MLSIKITIILIILSLTVWIIANMPPKLALLIYEIGSFLIGVIGVIFLIAFIALFFYSRYKF